MIERIFVVLRKDLQLGPRSPIFLWVLILPLLITVLLQVAFGSLFESTPRLGIVDQGASTVTTSVQAIEGIELALLDDIDDLKRKVEGNDLDAGLPAGKLSRTLPLRLLVIRSPSRARKPYPASDAIK